MLQAPPQVAQVIGNHAELQAHFIASREAGWPPRPDWWLTLSSWAPNRRR